MNGTHCPLRAHSSVGIARPSCTRGRRGSVCTLPSADMVQGGCWTLCGRETGTNGSPPNMPGSQRSLESRLQFLTSIPILWYFWRVSGILLPGENLKKMPSEMLTGITRFYCIKANLFDNTNSPSSLMIMPLSNIKFSPKASVITSSMLHFRKVPDVISFLGWFLPFRPLSNGLIGVKKSAF